MSETPTVVAIELEKVREEMRAGFEATDRRFERVEANVGNVALEMREGFEAIDHNLRTIAQAVASVSDGQAKLARMLQDVGEHLGAVKELSR